MCYAVRDKLEIHFVNFLSSFADCLCLTSNVSAKGLFP